MPRSKQFKEEEAIENALQLFWGNGYHATSMQALVSHLKINRASMYDSFKSKHHLFVQALERYITDTLKWWNETLYYETNVRTGIIKLVEHDFNLSLNNGEKTPCFVLKTTLELSHKDETVNQMVDRFRQSQLDMIYNYLTYGVNQGQISPYKNTKDLSEYILDIVVGVSVSYAHKTQTNYVNRQTNSILSSLS